MKQDYTGKTNEELVALYKAGDQIAFNYLLKNTESFRFSLAHRFLNIPGSELEDLMQEGAMELSKLALMYNPLNGSAFTTFIYPALEQKYTSLFRDATAKKRNPCGMVFSFDQMNENSEYEDEGNTLGNEYFSVECEEYSMIEIMETLKTLSLSGNEKITIRMLIDGKSKPEIAKLLKVKAPTVHSYVKRAGQKMKMCGAFA